MRQRRVVLAKLVVQRVKRFLRLALARYEPERPVRYFVAAGKPFVRPGKQDGPGQSAFGHALDVPAEHFRLLFLRMANCVHTELPQNERTLAGEILQAQKVMFEIALVVEVDVEAEKIDVLRQQIFGRRKSRVGKENTGIFRASDPNKILN